MCINKFDLDATNKRFDTFIRETITDITELKASLQNEANDMKQDVNNSQDQHVAADSLLQKLDADVKRVDETADYLENQSRRTLMKRRDTVHNR